MSSRISVFAAGLLTIGLASGGVQALPFTTPSHLAERGEASGVQTLLSCWLAPFFERHHVPASQGLKGHARSSWKFQAKEGTHLDPNGQH